MTVAAIGMTIGAREGSGPQAGHKDHAKPDAPVPAGNDGGDANPSPEGSVVASDISSGMLDYGRERAAAAGVENMEFVESDAISLDLPAQSFDAALSRWGIIFEPDGEGAAARVRGFLEPGGRMAIASWGPPERVPMLAVPMMTAMKRLDLPPPCRRRRGRRSESLDCALLQRRRRRHCRKGAIYRGGQTGGGHCVGKNASLNHTTSIQKKHKGPLSPPPALTL